MLYSHTLTFDELAAAYMVAADGTNPSAARQAGAFASIHTDWTSMPGWVGDTVNGLRDKLKRGYIVPGMKLHAGRPTRPRRKMRFDEEGELQVDLALSGHDMPFLNWTPRKRQAGLKLQVELATRGSTSAETLTDYARWTSALIAGLQERGFDLQIDVVSRAKGLVGSADQVDLNVRVKRFGRKSDLKSWGAIFSPGGFRSLIFLGRILACEANGVACRGMGGSFGPDWGIDFDRKARTLTIKCAAISERFPAADMDAKLAALKI